MGVMSVRDLDANVAEALRKAEAGEDIVLTRDGEPVLRITKEGVAGSKALRVEALDRLRALMQKGIPGLQAPLSYDERTER